jgi:hypothetical protein
MKQKRLLFYRQFDMLYDLSKSKTIVSKKVVILKSRFSRKLAYKGLGRISTVDNL